MGCDIHAYVETKREERDWYCACIPDIGRDYALFGLLAGVRNKTAESMSPKGLPIDGISWRTQLAYGLHVYEGGGTVPDEGYCTREDADRWLAAGWSVTIGDNLISNPDWHTPSWVTVTELESVLPKLRDEYDACNRREQEEMEKMATCAEERHRSWEYVVSPEIPALIAYMKGFAEAGYDTRLVFWFDN